MYLYQQMPYLTIRSGVMLKVCSYPILHLIFFMRSERPLSAAYAVLSNCILTAALAA